MREGVKICRDLLSRKAFDSYRGPEHGPGSHIRTNAAIEQHIREKVDSNYHICGTCKMGTDEEAVVDGNLRVHGLERLRVIDASIMPAIVSANTNAATIMIAEKGADILLQSTA